MDLQHKNSFFQFLTDDLLYYKMNLFFQIENLQLLIFCMSDQGFPTSLNYVHVSFCNIIKVNHFLHCFIIFLYLVFYLLHIKFLLVPYAYAFPKVIDCILLSSLELNAILLTPLIKILCLSLLNSCCVFKVFLFFLFFYEFLMIFFKTICITLFCWFIYVIYKLSCFERFFIVFKFNFSFYDTFVFLLQDYKFLFYNYNNYKLLI